MHSRTPARIPGSAVSASADLSERVEVGPPGWQGPGPDRALDGESLRAVAIGREPVAELLADEVPGQLIKQQQALADRALLASRQDGHDETVADIDVELVSCAPARCVRVQPAHVPSAMTTRQVPVLVP